MLTATPICDGEEALPIGPVEKEAYIIMRHLGTIHLHKEQYADARAYTERMMRSQLNKLVEVPDDASLG